MTKEEENVQKALGTLPKKRYDILLPVDLHLCVPCKATVVACTEEDAIKAVLNLSNFELGEIIKTHLRRSTDTYSKDLTPFNATIEIAKALHNKNTYIHKENTIVIDIRDALDTDTEGGVSA
jgi:Fe-S-cluster-containing dehydrogenase component